MIATVDGRRITKGLVRVPRRGGLWADVELETDATIEGEVTLSIGDASYVADVVRGGSSVGVAQWLLRGGHAWESSVRQRGYQSDAGVRLRTVLRDLARDVGRDERIVMPTERVIGRHYSRAGGGGGPDMRAADLLSGLVPTWHVNAANDVVCDARASGEVSTLDARVLQRHMTQPHRVVGTETPSAFVPGLSFEGTIINGLTFSISKSAIVLGLWGPS